MSALLHAFCALSSTMMALALLSPITLASAKAASTQSIVFVNNSINEPAFDSFIQIDAFSTASPKLLDSKVQRALPTTRASTTPVQLLTFTTHITRHMPIHECQRGSDASCPSGIVVIRLRQRRHSL